MPTLNYFDKDKQEWVAIPLGGGSDSAITVHAGSPPVPLSGDPTPQELEDSFAALPNGLHYYPDNGSLVAVLRGEYQTTITITGPVKSVAQIVKSSAGLPTPENPSMIVTQNADGRWSKVIGNSLDQPFGDPQMVDIFALLNSGDLTALSAYYTGLEVEALLAPIKADIAALTANQTVQPQPVDLDPINSQLLSLATITQGVMDKVDTKADSTTVSTLANTLMNSIMEVNGLVAGKADQSEFSAFQGQYGTLEAEFREYFRLLNQGFATVVQKDDVYTKQEVDDKIEAEKDFSIANDNILLASLTSLQEIVSNLGGDIGTGQIDVLDAIRGVEIEPSMVTFSGDTTSPIAWKGGLSLTPVKQGDDWRLHWNDGKAIHTLLHADDFTPANIVLVLDGQDVSVANLKTGGFELNELAMGAAGDRLITQVAGGPENTVAYLSDIVAPDLSGYAKTQDNAQQLLAKTIVAQAVGFGDSAQPPVALAYADSGDGYGDRLVLNIGLTNEYLVYKSDLDSVFPVIDTSQFATTITAAALDARINTLESTRATTTTTTSLDTRIKSLESKSAATSNINDASNAALKKSILDAVALMIAGGTKQPPADIDWTACRSENLSGNHPTAQARMIAGVIELRGIVAVNNLSSNSFFTHLPSNFPLPELDIYVPVGARLNTGPAVAAFVTIDKSTRRIGFIAGSTISELHLTGVRVKAAY